MQTRIFFLLLLTTFSSFASVQYTLQGTIGKAKICMKFEDYTMDYPKDEPRITDMRYFYHSSLKDIVLEGHRNKNTFVFYFGKDDTGFKEKFTLVKSNNTFSGTWENGKGKKIPVKLFPITIQENTNPYDHIPFIKEYRKTDLYEYIRSGFLQFQEDSISSLSGKNLRWVHEKHGDTYGFYLSTDFDPAAQKRINPQLEEILVRNAMDQLSCSSSFDYSSGGNIEYTITPDFLDKNLLSFAIWSSYYCGGAHPDFGKTGYLFDLNTGKDYSLEDILVFDASVAKYEENADSEQFSKFTTYRSTYFAPKIIELLLDAKQIYPAEAENEDEISCNDLYLEPDSWTFADWEFTAKGIVFYASVFRAARACETEGFLISFDKLQPFKSKEFPYSFPKN